MFERFTTAAREVVVAAQQEARDLKHPEIGTEHLLLALLAAEGTLAHRVLHDAGLAHDRVATEVRRLAAEPARRLDEADAAALETIGIDLDAVLARIEETFGPEALRQPTPPPRRSLLVRRLLGEHRPFTVRAKKALELALREAIRLGDRELRTEHLLLGLLRDGGGVAAAVIAGAGLTPDGLRHSTEAAMGRPVG